MAYEMTCNLKVSERSDTLPELLSVMQRILFVKCCFAFSNNLIQKPKIIQYRCHENDKNKALSFFADYQKNIKFS